MRSLEAYAGEGPVLVRKGAGRVLRFDRRRADPRGWHLAELVAADRQIRVSELFGPERGKAEIALARQLAMYLMHTHYSRIYSEVGRFFGRDRTTVSHACALIEEMREDPAFDDRVGRIERELAGEATQEQELAHAAG